MTLLIGFNGLSEKGSLCPSPGTRRAPRCFCLSSALGAKAQEDAGDMYAYFHFPKRGPHVRLEQFTALKGGLFVWQMCYLQRNFQFVSSLHSGDFRDLQMYFRKSTCIKYRLAVTEIQRTVRHSPASMRLVISEDVPASSRKCLNNHFNFQVMNAPTWV